MTDMQNTMKSAARLKAMYLQHPYTGNNRAPERYQCRPEYYNERHRLIVQWSSSSKEARVAAELSMRFEGLIDDAPLAIDGEKLRRPTVGDYVALRLLCQTVSWCSCALQRVTDLEKDILSFLDGEGYDIQEFTYSDVLPLYEIPSKLVAYQVSKRLIKMQRMKVRPTRLENDLLEILHTWNSRQAFGAMLPKKLKKLRKSKRKTQQDIADILDITLRQYARYEHGGTPVPDDVVTAIEKL